MMDEVACAFEQVAFVASVIDAVRRHDGLGNAPALVAKLTPREREVLQFSMAGLSNKEIARIVDRSLRTVEMQRASVMKRFGVQKMTLAVLIGMAGGLAPIESFH